LEKGKREEEAKEKADKLAKINESKSEDRQLKLRRANVARLLH
jgi:hypothetical protein